MTQLSVVEQDVEYCTKPVLQQNASRSIQGLQAHTVCMAHGQPHEPWSHEPGESTAYRLVVVLRIERGSGHRFGRFR